MMICCTKEINEINEKNGIDAVKGSGAYDCGMVPAVDAHSVF